MGRRRGTKRRKEDGEQKKEAEQQVGRDPLLRLVAPSPAGSVVALAVGSHLRLVDSSSGDTIPLEYGSLAPAQPAPLRVLCFSADGSCLMTAGDDKTVRLWDTSSWKCFKTLTAPKKISAGCFSADSRHAYCANKFGDVLVISSSSPSGPSSTATAAAAAAVASHVQPSVLLQHFNSIVTSLAVSPDDRLFASCDRDYKVRVSVLPADPTAGSYQVQSYCLGHTACVLGCAWLRPSSGGRLLLATCGGDGTVRLWEPLTGALLDTCVLATAPAKPAAEEEAAAAESSGGSEDEEEEEAGGSADGSGDDEEGGDEEGGGRVAGSSSSDTPGVLALAADAGGHWLVAVVEGSDDVSLLSVDQAAGKLRLQSSTALEGVRLPCSVAVVAGGNHHHHQQQQQQQQQQQVWVVGGKPPLPDTTSAHVGVAVVTAAAAAAGGDDELSLSLQQVPALQVLPGGAAALSALEMRSVEEEAALAQEPPGSASLYSSHLRRRQYDPARRAQQKARRNDTRETARLAALVAAEAEAGGDK